MLKKTVQQLEVDLKRETMHKNAVKWVPDLGIVSHNDSGEQMLDVFPVYRTWECSSAYEFSQGYHPYLATEEN